MHASLSHVDPGDLDEVCVCVRGEGSYECYGRFFFREWIEWDGVEWGMNGL